MKISDNLGRLLVLTKTTLSEIVPKSFGSIGVELLGKTYSKVLLRNLETPSGLVKLIGLNGFNEGREWFNATYDLRKECCAPFVGCRPFTKEAAEKIRKAIRALRKTKKKGTPKKKKK